MHRFWNSPMKSYRLILPANKWNVMETNVLYPQPYNTLASNCFAQMYRAHRKLIEKIDNIGLQNVNIFYRNKMNSHQLLN